MGSLPHWRIALLFWGLLCDAVYGEVSSFGAYHWRYSSPRSGPGNFYVGTDISLEFVSDAAGNLHNSSQITWIIPASCSKAQADATIRGNAVITGSRTLTANCQQSGVFLFQVGLVDSGIMDEFYVTVKIKQACFRWTLSITDGTKLMYLSPGVQSQIRIWVVDPIIASHEEMNGMVLIPSAESSSRSITRQLQRLGEAPALFVKDASHNLNIADFPSNIHFNATELYWYFNYTPSHPNSIHLQIAGEGANFLGCHVGRTDIILNAQLPMFELKTLAKDTWHQPLTLEDYRLRYDSCSTNLITLVIDGASCSKSFLMTNDQFVTSTFITVDSMNICLKDLWPRQSGYFVVLDDMGTLHLTNDFKEFREFLNNNTPLPKVTRVRANDACDSIYESDSVLDSTLNDILLAWDDSKEVTSFYVLNEKDKSVIDVKLPEDSLIMDIMIQTSLPYYVVLASNRNQSKLLVYNYKLQDWSPSPPYIFPKDKIIHDGGDVGASKNLMKSTKSTSAEGFIYGDSIFYSPDGGYSAYEINPLSRKSSEGGLKAGEYIKDVQTSTIGEFWALTSLNRIFSGAVTSREMIEIQSGAPESVPMFIFSRTDGVLLSVTPQNSISDLSLAYIIPHKNEVISPRKPLKSNPILTCPFQSWSDNITSLVHTIDYLDQAHYHMVMIYTGENTPSFSLLTSQANISKIEAKSSSNPFGSFMQTTTNFTLENNIKYISNVTFPTTLGAETRTDVRLSTSIGSLACHVHQKVMQIKWGCPLGKSIQVSQLSYDPADCPEWDGASISEHINPKDIKRKPLLTTDELKQYNVSIFGCPIKRRNTNEAFLPRLTLLQDGIPVGSVKANYVIYEVNGRSDFSYNLTETDVRCLVRQMGWSERLKNNTDPKYAWTSRNMMNCFASNSSIAGARSSPYEILNGTSKNAITFHKAEGLFIFQIRIVEPSYSFCDLTTFVAFDIHPKPKELPVTLIVIFVVIAIFAIVIGLSYSVFRKKKRH